MKKLQRLLYKTKMQLKVWYLEYRLSCEILEYYTLEHKDPCFYIKGKYKSGDVWYLAMSKKTFKIEEFLDSGDFERIRTIHRIHSNKQEPYWCYDYIINVRNWFFVTRTIGL